MFILLLQSILHNYYWFFFFFGIMFSKFFILHINVQLDKKEIFFFYSIIFQNSSLILFKHNLLNIIFVKKIQFLFYFIFSVWCFVVMDECEHVWIGVF